MCIPTKGILGSNGVQSSEQCNVDLLISELRHGHSSISAVPAKVILHCWESKFYRVEIGRIWRQEFTTHSSVVHSLAHVICSATMYYLASIKSWMSGCLWILQLSITITEFRAGYGCMLSSKHSTNWVKVSVQNDPSTISQCRMPSKSESVGRTEKLHDHQ